MFPWMELSLVIVRSVWDVVMDVNYWLILALVGYQYRQMQKSQQRMFGVCSCSLPQQLLLAGILGLVGGSAGSLLLTFTGVTLNQLGFMYIWPVALVLMLINMRFLCFAYAGGLVALANVILGWPEVNVPHLLALIAVLHITESLLIAISGSYSAMPLIVRKPDGRLVGGFSLQNFWPLPLVILAAVAVPAATAPDSIMPSWWPLLPAAPQPQAGTSFVYALAPVVAALGYTDIALASLPDERRRQSALHLAGYSTLLLALALLSAHYVWLQPVAALLSPLGHEWLIQLDNRREMALPPRFVPPPYGLMVLDTAGDSPAAAVLKPGDIMLSLAGWPLASRDDLAMAVSQAPANVDLVFERAGSQICRQLVFAPGRRRLGVILVPDGDEPFYVEMTTNRYGLIDWLISKLKKQ